MPTIITTWKFGAPANEAAWPVLAEGGTALDATIAGATYCELDESVDNVGYGGLPDADGNVSLDASVMDHMGRCGAVACVRKVLHVAQLARRVMERTPHVMLVGESADRFAIEQGFQPQNLLSPAAAESYRKWRASNRPQPAGHDTITLLARDKAGRLAGTCSTSGTAWKKPGRVGDSPIIGAGMYVDGQVGAAGATGIGEEVVPVCGSYAVVENMRRGMEPLEAIRDVLQRVLARRAGDPNTDVSLIALRADGAYAGMSLRKATKFFYAVRKDSGPEVIEAPTLFP
jgi:isoaspartyl peptidase/L-asparaginase-like protein (Ntn-hydrolase superfamily)